MRWGDRDEAGAAAAETGLLIASITLLLVPSLLVLGGQVKGSLGSLCENPADSRCEIRTQVAQPQPPPLTTARATELVALEVARRAEATNPDGGPATAQCDQLAQTTPPRGSTTRCTVRFEQTGEQVTVVVTWVDDAGTFEVQPG